MAISGPLGRTVLRAFNYTSIIYQVYIKLDKYSVLITSPRHDLDIRLTLW